MAYQSWVKMNLNEQENPVEQFEQNEDPDYFNVSNLNFSKPNTVGKENYVDKFTDALLEGAIDTELPLD